MDTQDLTIKEVAKVFNISLSSVWKMIGNEMLKSYRVGRSVRIPYSEIDRIREDHRITPDTLYYENLS